MEAVTVSEAISRTRNISPLKSLVPGSWINANFNVWIGAPEDNRAWDYLHHAREFYAQNAARATKSEQTLAYEELLIAEGSDWLGAMPPDYLSQPITAGEVRPAFTPQTAYIHPRITGDKIRYFEWMGAAIFTADQRAGAMHGKQFLLDSVYAGIDGEYVYGRLDFAGPVPEMEFDLVVNLESWANGEERPQKQLRVDARVEGRKLTAWKVDGGEAGPGANVGESAKAALLKNFEFRLPLSWLLVGPASESTQTSATLGVNAVARDATDRVKLRFSIWQNRLPVDALPVEGWIELQLLTEWELAAG